MSYQKASIKPGELQHPLQRLQLRKIASAASNLSGSLHLLGIFLTATNPQLSQKSLQTYADQPNLLA